MSNVLKRTTHTVVAALLMILLPAAQAQAQGPAGAQPPALSGPQQAVAANRIGAIQQIMSTWGSQAGPAEQFQATLNAANDGTLARLLSATSLQQLRSFLLGNLAAQASGSGVMALGDVNDDLTFTPNNPPCRVFDTRFIGAGVAPAAASTSSYQVYGNAATISAQGGNAAGCAAPKGEPVAVSANFTAVPVGFQGHIRVFPFSGPLPTVSFVNFNGVVGNNIANSGIISTCYICAFDLSVYNGSQTHHIGDVMGFFYPATFNNIDLPNSTASTGNILKNGSRFIHNYGAGNTFIGESAGNYTMTGFNNTASGILALTSNTTGAGNTATGTVALMNNTTGSLNTATGGGALFSNTTGGSNTANGLDALQSNTTGGANIAVGANSMQLNTTGDANTAIGTEALRSNTSGIWNTVSGYQALFSNTTGNFNNAFGVGALFSNTTGERNVAVGVNSLTLNTTGIRNTAIGTDALKSNATGIQNTAQGFQALISNTTGSLNTAHGMDALFANTTGDANTALGLGAGFYQTTGSANIYVGNGGVAGESNTIRIGNPAIAAEVPYLQNRFFAVGIRGTTTGIADALPVLIDSAGQLGTLVSSRKAKQDIVDMAGASSVLMDLRPVTFRYTAHGDAPALQYGLIAEEVAEAAPGLVARAADGTVETVYYQHLAPMLLNEYQKQQRTIEKQTAETENQRAEIVRLNQDRVRQAAEIAELKKQTAEIAMLRQEVAELASLRQQTARMAELLERLGRMEVAAGR